MSDFPNTVTGEILPGKVDPSSKAQFANTQRAEHYALDLANSGDYSHVWLSIEGHDAHPPEVHLIKPQEVPS